MIPQTETRFKLVQQRIVACERAIARLERLAIQCETRQQEAQRRMQSLTEHIAQAKIQVRDLQAQPVSTRPDGPYSQLSKLKRQVAGWQNQMCRAQRVIAQAQKAQLSHQERLVAWHSQRTDLQARCEQLCQQNSTTQRLVRCTMRLDAGFSSGENITALIELGYDLDTKSGNAMAGRP
jgi:chromosome segregation ATPase